MCNRARYSKCATNSGGQWSFDLAFQYPTTWFYSGARYTIHRKAQLWHDQTHRKNSISVYFHKRDGVLITPKSIPAETVRYQEQTLLATQCACQTLLLPRERQQYNEFAISMVTTTRSTGYTKWRCLSRRKGHAIVRNSNVKSNVTLSTLKVNNGMFHTLVTYRCKIRYSRNVREWGEKYNMLHLKPSSDIKLRIKDEHKQLLWGNINI
jgi:hypothetical protein